MVQGQRRLAAIMFTDMVGYTTLSQTDEDLALELLEAQRRIVRSWLPKFHGREIKTMGDAFLLEFASALEASRCAFEIQRAVKELNSGRPPEKKISLRIGIHLGDVVHSKRDIYGDATNIASRIESLAEPGGISMTEQVSAQIKNKFELPISSIGKRKLKNVGEPIGVYRVVLPWDENQNRTDYDEAPKLDKRRVAVLPFVNISPDPADEYLADGMTEEMIARLSWIHGIDVIARTSVMNYKKKSMKAVEIGTELGAGSLLEGSVRKAGERLRITVQLIDSRSELHLWAENYDRDLADIFEVQGEVASKVAEHLKVKLLPPERNDVEKRPTDSVNAYTLYLKGRMIWSEQNLSSFLKAVEYFQKAIKLDSRFALAHAGLADCYSLLGDIGHLDQSEAISKAEAAARTAIKLDERLAEAHSASAPPRYHRYDLTGAEVHLLRAVELKPSYALAHAWLGVLYRVRGRNEEALARFKRAGELDPSSAHMSNYIANTLRVMHKDDEAFGQLERTFELDQNNMRAHEILGFLHLQRSAFPEAIRELQMVSNAEPDDDNELSGLGVAFALAGMKDKAIEIKERLEKKSSQRYVAPDNIAVVSLVVGEEDEAYALFNQAVDEYCSSWIMGLKSSPIFDPYRNDGRFAALVRRVGL